LCISKAAVVGIAARSKLRSRNLKIEGRREELAFYCVWGWLERVRGLRYRDDDCRKLRFYGQAVLLDSSRVVWLFISEPIPAGRRRRNSLVVVRPALYKLDSYI
jgi:hypothetical protein